MAQAPVHRIWSIAEVIREVVQHHEDNPGTLASCACVSRAFSEPALEVLWKVADGLVNLFSLLSKSMKTLFGGEDKYHVRSTTTPLDHDAADSIRNAPRFYTPQ